VRDVTGVDAQGTELGTLARLHVGLLEVAGIVTSSADLPALLDAIARTIAESLGWRTVAINLHRRAWDDLQVQTVFGAPEARDALIGNATAWHTWDRLLQDRYLHRGAYLIRHDQYDWAADDTVSYVPPTPVSGDPDDWHPGDALFVALRDSEGQIMGMLSVDEPKSGRVPTGAELDALVAVAGHAAIAVRQAQEHADLREHRVALEHFLDIFSRYRGSAETQELLDAVASGIWSTLGFERVGIELLEQGADAPLARLLLPRFERHGIYLFTAAEAAELVPEVDLGPPSERSGRGPYAWQDHRLLVPLNASTGELLGVIRVEDPSDRLLPSTQKLQALRVFADQAATALESAARVRELRYLADHDPLTGLGNRRAFMRSLDGETARANRYGSRLTLALCDVDAFKTLNDQHGHPAGDRALARVARVLESSLRRSDGAYRIGGDEFALVLPEAAERDAAEITGRIQAALDAPGPGGDPPVRVSFGTASPRSGESPEDLLRRADEAMYVSKRARGST
jgi:diguanylate cyclase (GGDEF)-like protein